MKKILTILILGIISILSLSFIIVPKETFSEIENRTLASMPKFSISKIIDGTYMKEIETYTNDNFPLRNLFMNIRTITHKLLGKQNINDVYFGENNYLLEDYQDINNKEEIIKTINKFKNKNPNTNTSIMLIPTKIAIYSDKLPINANINNQENEIKYIYDNLGENINKIEITNKLISQKDNYQLYYKTDHHWTTYGAYFGYKEFARTNNIDYIDITEFNIKTITDSFKGSTYSKVVDPYSQTENIDIFEYQEYDLDVDYVLSNKKTKTLYNYDYLNKKDKYALFLDNNHPLIIITNNTLENNNSILIIKDSYANSMIPFLVNHYQEIHIIDPRYYKKSITSYLENYNIKNILILYNIGTLSTDDNILSIR